MTEAAVAADPAARLQALLEQRTEANDRFFTEAERLARLCHLMAERFARGGRLIAFGRSPAARSDARHVAVEFVHPVIVGKRALPAIGLAGEGGDLAAQVELLARADDIAIALRHRRGWRRGRPCAGAGPCPRLSDDRLLAQRRRTRVRAADQRPVHPPGAGRDALPPAVGARARVLRPPRAARRARSPPRPRRRRVELPVPVPGRARARARAGGRRRPPIGADEGAGDRRAASSDADRQRRNVADRRRRSAARGFERGGKLLALGNGGSATDAMDAVADFRAPRADRAAAGRRST